MTIKLSKEAIYQEGLQLAIRAIAPGNRNWTHDSALTTRIRELAASIAARIEHIQADPQPAAVTTDQWLEDMASDRMEFTARQNRPPVCPWKDAHGNTLYAGDIIRVGSNQEAEIVHVEAQFAREEGRWRLRYADTEGVGYASLPGLETTIKTIHCVLVQPGEWPGRVVTGDGLPWTHREAREWAVQAAHFAACVRHDRLDTDATEGIAGLCELLAEEAMKFQEYHIGAQLALRVDEAMDYWESVDWYTATDEWFAEKIAPRIYFPESGESPMRAGTS